MAIPARLCLTTIAAGLLVLMAITSACISPAPPTPQILPDGLVRHWPQSSPVGVGTTAEMRLYTHCGLQASLIDFSGRLWDPLAPEQAVRRLGDPFDEGVITLVGPEQAAYTSSTGAVLLLVPHQGAKDIPICY